MALAANLRSLKNQKGHRQSAYGLPQFKTKRLELATGQTPDKIPAPPPRDIYFCFQSDKHCLFFTLFPGGGQEKGRALGKAHLRRPAWEFPSGPMRCRCLMHKLVLWT